MKTTALIILISIFLISCNKEEEVIQDPLPLGVYQINVVSSSYKLPFNEYGFAVLKATTNFGNDVTNESSFYVNDQRLEQNIFRPSIKGIYKIHSVYRSLKSNSIEIAVEEPLNKKVLIESFTSRICGFCPWISLRLDSLHKANNKVISYSIHGLDELEVMGTPDFQEYLNIHYRPAIRIERGYVRNYEAPIEIKGLIDSVNQFLSVQPKVELSIQTSLQQNNLSVNVLCKYYEEIQDSIYLSVALIEDSVMTFNQYNYFSGYPASANPFIHLPNPIPEYNNFNVLRRFLTPPRGETINTGETELNIPVNIGSFDIQLENVNNPHNSYIIAILHKRSQDIEISSVLNTQIVKVGEEVDFNE